MNNNLAITKLWFVSVFGFTIGAALTLSAPQAQAQTPAETSRTSAQRAHVEPVRTGVRAKPASPQATPFRWTGEEVFYSIRLNGAEALRAGIRAGEPRTMNNRIYVPISGAAQSMGFFNSVYPLDDRANTFISAESFKPIRSEKVFNEKGQTRIYNVDYLHSDFEARVERTRPSGTTIISSAIPGDTHDMVSWIYDMRATETMEVGKRMSFFIYDGWLLSRLDLHVVGHDDVLTPMGWFHAWKIDFSREVMQAKRAPRKRANDAPKEPALRIIDPGKHRGSFWLSRDENLIPIKLSIGTILGVGEAVVIRYKPAKN